MTQESNVPLVPFRILSYLSFRAATPGRVLPSRNSRLAPPPVEMWSILSAKPSWVTAAALSTYIDDTAAAFVAGIYRF